MICPGDTLNYFVIEDPKFARFYLLPKIHKRLHNVPGRIVPGSTCQLQSLAQEVKSYIKDTNHFLNKIRKLGGVPDGAVLCIIDVADRYPNIPYGKVLPLSVGFLETSDNKQISSDTLTELAEVVLN